MICQQGIRPTLAPNMPGLCMTDQSITYLARGRDGGPDSRVSHFSCFVHTSCGRNDERKRRVDSVLLTCAETCSTCGAGASAGCIVVQLSIGFDD